MIPILRRVALVLVFLWFMIGGVAHFSLTELEMRIVPPANVYMLQHAELFNVPRWALIVRLPFQAALLAMIIWSTWNAAPPSRVDS
jgi:uncharacterized membrane protein